MKRYESFQRQLNMYGFKRLTKEGSGRESSRALYHPYFLYGRVNLSIRIKRIPYKGTKVRGAAKFNDEPKFFLMRPCRDISPTFL